MARPVWKGAISFGLVHVPIVVYAAARSARLDFDWIDRRDDAPIGYQRINKRTGKSVDSDNIVKGYAYAKDEYVYMSDTDFQNAASGELQTIALLDFVSASEVPLYYFDTPYYLAPDKRGNKGYALLRDALIKTGRVGLAYVVLHTRQHLAVVMPMDETLVMMTMRWANEIRPIEEVAVPPAAKGKDAPSKSEVEMAVKLVDSMTSEFDPEKYVDQYRENLLESIEKKVKAGKTHDLSAPSEEPETRPSAKVIDLMAVLRQSVANRSASSKSGSTAKGGADSGTGGSAKAGSKTPAKAKTKANAGTESKTKPKPAGKSAVKASSRSAGQSDGRAASGASSRSKSRSAAKSPARAASKRVTQSAAKPAGKKTARSVHPSKPQKKAA